MITALLLIYGKMGDKYGHTRLFVVGLAAWVVFSVITGLAQDIHQLIVFRALQGAAWGISLAMPLAIITSVFAPQERGRAMGMQFAATAVGMSLGPLYSGLVTDLVGWRFIFFIDAGLAFVALLGVLRWLPHGRTLSTVGFDPSGAVSVFIFLSSLVLWVSQGRAWGWTSPVSVSLLGFVLVAGLALVWLEGRATYPLIKLSLFANLTLSLGTVAALFNFMARYMLIFAVPFYLRFVLALSPGKLGMIMAALPTITLVVAPLSGALSDRIGSRPLTMAGTAFCSLALFSMSWLDASSDPLDVVWRLAFFGLGAACFNIPNQRAVMSSIEKENLGIGSAILTLGRNLGWSLGIAVAGTMLYGITPSQLSLEQVGILLGSVRATYVVAACFSAAAFSTTLLSAIGTKAEPDRDRSQTG